jgi:hypothetical protein
LLACYRYMNAGTQLHDPQPGTVRVKRTSVLERTPQLAQPATTAHACSYPRAIRINNASLFCHSNYSRRNCYAGSFPSRASRQAHAGDIVIRKSLDGCQMFLVVPFEQVVETFLRLNIIYDRQAF